MTVDVAFDLETALIEQGCMLPPISCGAFYDGATAIVTHVTTLRDQVTSLLKDALAGKLRVVAHNAAFDFGCVISEWPELIPLVWQAYESNVIHCTEIRQRMLDIANGCYEGFDMFEISGKREKIDYRLNTCAKRFLGYEIEGKGDLQLKYGPLRDHPITWWPRPMLEYVKTDVRTTLKVFNFQEENASYLVDQYRQTRAAFWLNLMSAWGIRTDLDRVLSFQAEKEEEHSTLSQELVEAGLMYWKGKRKPKLSKNTKAAKLRMQAVWDYSLGDLPSTKGGDVSLASEHLAKVNDPLLKKYAKVSTLGKALSTDIPALLIGTSGPIHSRFISIRDTGRTSSRKPNIQNVKREPGVRECFVPSDPSWVFIQSDWSSFELCTWAQVCFTILGHSRLRDVLNAEQDPHLEIASLILGRPVNTLDKSQKEVDDARQTGKVANFGFPGGLGPKSLVAYADSGYNVQLTLEQAKELKHHWRTSWPESDHYFSWIESQVGQGSGGLIEHLFSGRYRGNVRFTQACNSFFQGLASDAAKDAGWRIAKEMYTMPLSPLFGFRLVNFLHDEFIAEGPEDRAPEAAERLSQIMVEIGQKWIPDVLIRAEPCIMNCWSKKAKTLRDENGRLKTWKYAGSN